MTLQEAIEHAIEVTHRKEICQECKDEHRQLANWLIELAELREKNNASSGLG